jgi:hypothetical protein
VADSGGDLVRLAQATETFLGRRVAGVEAKDSIFESSDLSRSQVNIFLDQKGLKVVLDEAPSMLAIELIGIASALPDQ